MSAGNGATVLETFIKSGMLLFVLLNPFMMSIYLIDLIQELPQRVFTAVVARGAAISSIVFIVFALLGDRIFTDLIQARFASFLIFGGLIFLVIGVRFVFNGSETLKGLRGNPEHLGGSIAMPFMIGPGTVSASVLAGSRLSPLLAASCILLSLCIVVGSLAAFKALIDFLRRRDERLVERYLEMIGRVMALVIGTFAVEMILQGVDLWLGRR